MCLGVPGKILGLFEANGLPMGTVDFGGVRRDACLAYVPQAQVGDYVIIHVGFAISLLDEDEARRSLAALAEIIAIEDELGPAAGSQ